MEIIRPVLEVIGLTVVVGLLWACFVEICVQIKRWWCRDKAYSREDIRKIKEYISACVSAGEGSSYTCWLDKCTVTIKVPENYLK